MARFRRLPIATQTQVAQPEEANIADLNVNISELEDKTLSELQDMARSVGIAGYSRLKKNDLIFRLLRAKAEAQGLIFGMRPV